MVGLNNYVLRMVLALGASNHYEDMITYGAAHIRSLSMDHVEKRKLRPDLERHDPTTK